MTLTKPSPGDPFGTGATKSTTIVGAIVDYINQQPANVKEASPPATGDGSTDDSAAFYAAEAAGRGSIYVPPGTYRLDNYTPTTSKFHIRGAGMGTTILKAKAGATAALSISALNNVFVQDLTIDGNAVASDACILTPSSSTANQHHAFYNVLFQNGTVGCNVKTNSPVSENDMMTFFHCQFSGNTTGYKNSSGNGQEHTFIGCLWYNNTTGIDLAATGAEIGILGGQCINFTTGLKFSTDAARVWITNFVFQSAGSGPTGATDIDGSTKWAASRGVVLTNVVLNGGMSSGDGTCITIGKDNSYLDMNNVTANFGAVSITGSQVTVRRQSFILASGATYSEVTSGVGSGTRRWDLLTQSGAVVGASFVNGIAVSQEAGVLADLRGWTFDPAMIAGGTAISAAATLTLCKIPLPGSTSVTNVIVQVQALGATLTHSYLALYTSAGTVIAQSADQSSTWGSAGSTGLKTVALTGGPYTVAPVGGNDFVWVAIYVGTSTGALPAFQRGNSIGAVIAGQSLARSRFGTIAQADTSTLANITPGSITQLIVPYWAAIS